MSSEHQRREPRGSPGKKILLVDDDNALRDMVVRFLEGKGFDVEHAADGVRALGLLRESPPDLVISDLDMPHMSGLDLLSAARAEPDLAAVPFLIVSGNYEDELVRRATALGASNYLQKPITLTDLVQAVSDILEDHDAQ